MALPYVSINAPGINDEPFAVQGADLIENLRYDFQNECWVNDRILSSYLNPDVDPFDPSNAVPAADVYSIASWRPRGGFPEYLLYEYDAGTSLTLAVRIGNRSHDLQTGRPYPTSADASTQYIAFNTYMVILNGYSPPVIYQGDLRWRPMANTQLPSPISIGVPAGAISNYNEEASGLFIRAANSNSANKLLQFPVGSGYGVGLGARQYTHYDQTSQEQVVFSELITNTYEYAVQFITDTGSASPLSDRSNRASFIGGGTSVTDQVANDKLVTARYGMNLQNIPIGPPGTVRRLIHRTKNMGDERGGFGEELYFLTYIDDNSTESWLDAIPDSALGSLAPLSFELIPVPTASIGASFQNRLFLAGDPNQPYAISYSSAGLPEEFRSQNVLSVSSRVGGKITGLVPYNNLLIVFRENSIDAIIATANGYAVTPVNGSIGSLSPSTATSIATLGLMFLGSDRKFYLLTGNYSGGSSLQVTEMSKGIGKYLRRINLSALNRAFALYIDRDREYWCHVPFNGTPITNAGLVYHLETGGWSLRRLPVALSGGTILSEGIPAYGTLYEVQGRFTGTTHDPLGIQVWTGVGNYPEAERLDFKYESKWLHFNQPEALKHIKQVFLYMYKNAYVDVTDTDLPYMDNIKVSCAVDNREYYRVMERVAATNPEQSRTGILDLIITDDGVINDYAIWDQNYYSNGDQVITVRISDNSSMDIGFEEALSDAGESMSATDMDKIRSGGCRWYKIRIENTDTDLEMRFLGFKIDYELNGKMFAYTQRMGVGIGG